MSKLKTAKRFAVGTMIAGVAGYLAGLLTAPKSGKETREELREAANLKVSEAEKQLKHLHTDLAGTLDDAKDRGDELSGRAEKELRKLVESASDTRQKVREILSSAHEGEVSDKDLKKAIADAKHTIDHLKDFLKK